MSPDDFARHFERAGPVLWALAVGVLGDRHHADDALQEAAVIGLQKLAEFEAGTGFTAWMGRIVRHVALNRRRKSGRRRTAATDPLLLDHQRAPFAAPSVDVRSDGELGDAAEHIDAELLAALGTLRPVVRACLLLRTLAELDYESIARLLDIPPGTAMSHVHRARALLQRELADTPIAAARTEKNP